MSKRFCPRCEMDTEHREKIRQKPSSYLDTKRGQFRAFLSGFFSGMGSHGIAALARLNRVMTPIG